MLCEWLSTGRNFHLYCDSAFSSRRWSLCHWRVQWSEDSRCCREIQPWWGNLERSRSACIWSLSSWHRSRLSLACSVHHEKFLGTWISVIVLYHQTFSSSQSPFNLYAYIIISILNSDLYYVLEWSLIISQFYHVLYLCLSCCCSIKSYVLRMLKYRFWRFL